MPDREKIINAIEKAKKQSEEYAQDRIIVPFKEADMILAMLKEQEPKEVKDKSTRIKFLDEYFEGECPSCRSFLDEHSNRNFCGYCGQAVKWD